MSHFTCCAGELCLAEGPQVQPPEHLDHEFPLFEESSALSQDESGNSGGFGGLNGMNLVTSNATSGLHRASAAMTDSARQLMRSVVLRSLLLQPFSFWLANPQARSVQQRQEIFKRSTPTTHFDVFLSHTWKTKGKWKFLSLLLNFGWPMILSCWLCGVILAFILVLVEAIPLFTLLEVHALDFDGVVPSACWVQALGLLGLLVGCVVAPLFQSRECFLDFACIDQTDADKMEQGIMSIGSFLAQSEELRVLWSSPFLSRLWCVFEIAAYRHLRPRGRMVIAPVNNECSACMMLFWMQVCVFCFWYARSGRNGGEPRMVLAVLISAFAVLAPIVACAAWRNHRSFEKLRADLANFDVIQARCSNDLDRRCIHDAIITWYGSLDDFCAYVRGPLSEEILQMMRSSHYVFLPVTPLVGLCLDNTLALWKANAPMGSVLSIFFNQALAASMLYIPAVAVFFTWLARRGLGLRGSRCIPLALEIALLLAGFTITAGLGAYVAAVLAARSIAVTLAWNASAVLLAGLVWRCCWR